MLSTDRETALDHLYGLLRGEIQPHDELVSSACVSDDIEDVEDVSQDEALTDDPTVEKEGDDAL